MAYDRRTYVHAALESVLAQTAPRAEFEVLLVTNLHDPDLDAWTAHHGIVTLRPTGSSIGEFLADAAERARGRVLALLDDDDLFAPEKLVTALAAFRSDPRLGYFHHGMIDLRGDGGGAGRRAGSDPGGRPRARIALIGPRPPVAEVERAWWYGAAHNSSAVCVRREIANGLGARLRAIQVGPTPLLFYAAVMGGWNVSAVPDPLGWRRLHTESSSGAGEPDAAVRWSKLLAIAPRAIADADVLRVYLRENDAPAAYARPLDAMTAREELLRAFASATASRRTVLERELGALRANFPGHLRATAPFLRCGAARLVSFKRARRAMGFHSGPVRPGGEPGES
jgi:glycosyltransferase involved in cell wall biosynthesis